MEFTLVFLLYCMLFFGFLNLCIWFTERALASYAAYAAARSYEVFGNYRRVDSEPPLYEEVAREILSKSLPWLAGQRGRLLVRVVVDGNMDGANLEKQIPNSEAVKNIMFSELFNDPNGGITESYGNTQGNYLARNRCGQSNEAMFPRFGLLKVHIVFNLRMFKARGTQEYFNLQDNNPVGHQLWDIKAIAPYRLEKGPPQDCARPVDLPPN